MCDTINTGKPVNLDMVGAPTEQVTPCRRMQLTHLPTASHFYTCIDQRDYKKMHGLIYNGHFVWLTLLTTMEVIFQTGETAPNFEILKVISYVVALD
jgi:hypothetical protein